MELWLKVLVGVSVDKMVIQKPKTKSLGVCRWWCSGAGDVFHADRDVWFHVDRGVWCCVG